MILSRQKPFIGILFLLIGLSAPVYLTGCTEAPTRLGEAPTDSVTHPIDRHAGPVWLGMSLREFKDAVRSSDQTEMNPGLTNEEKSFEIRRESLPDGIRAMGCRFLNGRLYRITADYNVGVFDEVHWSEVIRDNRERYGKAPLRLRRLSKYPTEVIQWEDSVTRLVLQRERRMRMKSRKLVEQTVVLMVLLDRVLWAERQAAEGRAL